MAEQYDKFVTAVDKMLDEYRLVMGIPDEIELKWDIFVNSNGFNLKVRGAKTDG